MAEYKNKTYVLRTTVVAGAPGGRYALSGKFIQIASRFYNICMWCSRFITMFSSS